MAPLHVLRCGQLTAEHGVTGGAVAGQSGRHDRGVSSEAVVLQTGSTRFSEVLGHEVVFLRQAVVQHRTAVGVLRLTLDAERETMIRRWRQETAAEAVVQRRRALTEEPGGVVLQTSCLGVGVFSAELTSDLHLGQLTGECGDTDL